MEAGEDQVPGGQREKQGEEAVDPVGTAARAEGDRGNDDDGESNAGATAFASRRPASRQSWMPR